MSRDMSARCPENKALRITVRDRSSRSPPGRLAGSIRPPPSSESGWGLYLVNQIASRWGTLDEEGGYWFELEMPKREEA